MNLSFFIAIRHLRSQHSLSFISLIGYLSILGLGIGIAVLLLTLSILKGFESQVENKIISFDGHIRVGGYLGAPVPETNSVLDSVLSAIPEVLDRAPYIHKSALIRFRTETEGILIEGISEKNARSVFGTSHFLSAGKFSFGENEEGYPGIVLGQVLAEKLNCSIGSRIVLLDLEGMGEVGRAPRINQFYLSGIYKTGLREYDESIVYIDLKSAQRLLGYDNQITGEVLKLAHINDSDRIANQIGESIGYPYIPSTWKDRHYNLFAWLTLQKYPITIIFALIALVAIVNITSSLTMIVMEKTRDIGVLRAIGYSRWKISELFFFEGGIIGLSGVMLGIGLALFFGFLQMKYHLITIPEDVYFMKELPILFLPVHFIIVGACGLVFALLATLYPAWKGSGIPPSRAIRYE